jgi:hypothetical protein
MCSGRGDCLPGGGGGARRRVVLAGHGAARISRRNPGPGPAPAAMGGGRSRWRRVPGAGRRPDAIPRGTEDHGAHAGRGVQAAGPGDSRTGSAQRSLPRCRDRPQLHRPARLRPHASRWVGSSGKAPGTGWLAAPVRTADAMTGPGSPGEAGRRLPSAGLGGTFDAVRMRADGTSWPKRAICGRPAPPVRAVGGSGGPDGTEHQMRPVAGTDERGEANDDY